MPVETLTGSAVNIGGKGDPERKRLRLESVRAASVVVATAGGFELAMHKVNSFRAIFLFRFHCGRAANFRRSAPWFCLILAASSSLPTTPKCHTDASRVYFARVNVALDSHAYLCDPSNFPSPLGV